MSLVVVVVGVVYFSSGLNKTVLVAGYINNGTIHTYEKDTVHEGIVH